MPMGYTPANYRRSIKDSKAYFAIFELPTLLFIAIVGFITEFLIEFPFMMVCLLDHRWKKRRSGSKK